MAYKLEVSIIDTGSDELIETLELILEQLRQGFRAGFDETTKDECACEYNYKVTEML